MNKLVASGVAALSIATGSIAVAVLNPLGSAGAQSTDGTTTSAPAATDATTTAKPERGAALKSVLGNLVTGGTITQAQADAITAGMDAFRAANPAPDHGRGRGGGGGMAGARLDDIATTLGITEDALRSQLQGGATLRTIAGDKVGALTTLLTDKANARIDQGVTDAKITTETAATMKAAVPAKVAAMLDGTAPAGGPGGRGGRGGHGPAQAMPSASGAATTN